MFDPTACLITARYLHIVRHEGCDYHVKPPLRVRLNPLRYEVGIGKIGRRWIVNEDGLWNRRVSDLTWRLWRRRASERSRASGRNAKR